MKLRLAEEDRERFSIPEWIDADPDRLTVEEAEAIDASGSDWTLFRAGGAKAVQVRVWVFLRRAGAEVPEKVQDLAFNMAGFDWAAPSPGKAPSAKSGARTPSTSARSSRATRSKTS